MTVMISSVGQLLGYLWNGPASLSGPLRLEWRFAAVRWLGMLLIAPLLPFAQLPPQRLVAAYGLVLVTGAYNLLTQRLILMRPNLVVTGYLTTFGDTLLDVAMVMVGGGFDTPFYFIVFTVVLSAAMRYGYGQAMAVALLFVIFDVFEKFPTIQSLNETPFLFRSAFLCLTALLASYLREQAHRAEMALQERLRQANLLNEATAMLGASLEPQTVLQYAATATSHLVAGGCVTLRPAPGLASDSPTPEPILFCPAQACSAAHADLMALSDRYARGTHAGGGGEHERFFAETLSSGEQALVLLLALPTRQVPLATIALTPPAGKRLSVLDPDILDSFVERTALAIENASLYRTLEGRSTDLQRAYSDLAMAHQDLLSIDEMKTNFLANVSHELRTPLTSIRSFSELLLSYDEDPSVRQEFMTIINSESERLTRLVNDVLDVTKIESGHMEWEMDTFDLAALLQDCARAAGPLMEQNNLLFEQKLADALPPVYGDRDRLQQVISNLLGNAVKFTPSGSITLTASAEDGTVRIAVVDSGIGIAAEDHERIFEKFQQVGNTLTEKPRGTGLGLAICRDIVAHHQGELWVESNLGAGSTFIFTLPSAVPAAVAVPVAA